MNNGWKRRCDSCERDVEARYEILGQRICNACYSRLRRNAATCPGCGVTKVLAFRSDSGQVVCATCAGVPARFGCTRCSSEEFLAGSHCGRCRLEERLNEVLTDDQGRIHPQLAPLRAHLLSTRDPRSAERWLRREPTGATLRAMAGGLKPVRHETLDELPPSTRLRYFRRTLIAAGCLPEIDVRLHDLALRTESFIQTLPADHAVIVARYFSWETLRKLRRRPLDRPVSVGVVNTRTTEVRKIAAFLAWLDENDVELETLQQVALDRYLAHRDPHRALARFLRWAVHHRVMPRVRLPPTPRVERGPATNADALWDHVDVLLHDETTPLPSRIIGLFLLVFAQPISDSARLRRDAVQGYGEELTVRFGTTPVKMPPPIASLLQQHLAEAGNRRPYVGQPSAWLFPGTMPQQHVTEDAVRGHLAKHGFHARAAKRARLHQLTQVLPASIVADITGYAVQTAVRHAAKSGAAWGAYPELRESETSELDGHK